MSEIAPAPTGHALALPADLPSAQRELRQLSLLFEATRLLNSTLDLAALLELILHIARRQIPAERGSVFLVEAEKGEIWSFVAEGIDAGAGHREIRLPIGHGIAGAVAASGEIVNTADPYADPRFAASFDEHTGFRTRSLLCLPIHRNDGVIVGVLQLLNHAGGAFTAEDETFLRRLSGHIALALENARLHRAAMEKERLERELELGHEIQRGLLPEAPPALAGYDIAVHSEPYFPVSGDYYDFLPLPNGEWLLVMADIEGKGVAAALVMSNVQASLRALLRHLGPLDQLVATLNASLLAATRGGKYLTLFLAALDPRTHRLRYVNAGHIPPLLMRADGRVEKLETGGTVVGLLPDQPYESGMAHLGPGDWLAYGTDGIVEAMNQAGEQFGIEGIISVLAAARAEPGRSAAALTAAVTQAAADFAREGTAADDKTLVIVQRR